MKRAWNYCSNKIFVIFWKASQIHIKLTSVVSRSRLYRSKLKTPSKYRLWKTSMYIYSSYTSLETIFHTLLLKIFLATCITRQSSSANGEFVNTRGLIFFHSPQGTLCNNKRLVESHWRRSCYRRTTGTPTSFSL